MTQTTHTCPECGGTMHEQTIAHEQKGEGGVLYVVQNVPAWVCAQCGETYLDAPVIQMLETIIRDSTPLKQVNTPTSIYDFQHAKA